MSAPIALDTGLSRAAVTDLSDLISDITGEALRGTPYLGPALLLSDPAVAQAFQMPVPAAGEVLIHDYQSIEMAAPFPLDQPLNAEAALTQKGATTELAVEFGETAKLRTALRLVAEDELAAASPIRMRDSEADAGPYRVSQAQVDRYVALAADPNPIHRAAGAAEALGLSAPVVPGVLLAGLIQPAIEQQWPDHTVTSLRVRFAAPLLVGGPVRVACTDRGTSDGIHRVRAFLVQDTGALALADLTMRPA